MDRRLLGVVMLVAAVVAVMAIPSLTGRRTSGTAVAVAFSGPPRVGQCLAPDRPAYWVVQPQTGSYVPQVPLDTIRFASCLGLIGGEIVSVWPTSSDPGFVTQAPRRNPCYPSTAAYAGLQTVGRSTDFPGVPAVGPVLWRPSIGFDPLQIVPGDAERRAGRDWVACLAIPSGHAGYVGTLREAFTSGAMPIQFGSCWAGADLDQLPVAVRCDEPHPAQLLAKGRVLDQNPGSTAAVEQSCTELAGRIMHTTDPTRDGKLKVVIDLPNNGGAETTQPPPTVACFVTTAGPQELSSTLIGLADRPVPLAG